MKRPFVIGTLPYLGDFLTMVINHLHPLTSPGMILQAVNLNLRKCRWKGGKMLLRVQKSGEKTTWYIYIYAYIYKYTIIYIYNHENNRITYLPVSTGAGFFPSTRIIVALHLGLSKNPKGLYLYTKQFSSPNSIYFHLSWVSNCTTL